MPILVSDFDLTLDRYHRMIATGILGPDDKLELLNGKLVKKTSISPGHASCLKILSKYFNRRYLDQYELMSENPITLPLRSEPEPDFTIAKLREDNYFGAHPVPEDVYLVIEIADNSLTRDRLHKASIYAMEGIAEYWIVNLRQRQVELHLEPDRQYGTYGRVLRSKSGTTFDSPFVGQVKVDDLLPSEAL